MLKTPRFWYRPAGLLAYVLWLPSQFYRAGRALHVKIGKPRTFSVPVICVGNLVAGGAGKTPTVLALTALLKEQGIAPHIVTRGYRGRLQGPVLVNDTHTAIDVGDEPLLLAAVAPTWVAKNRAAGIEVAIAAGAKVVLLDDGLQNPRLKAAANILVVDDAGFGNGHLLPAGPLREKPRKALRRIDAVLTINAKVPDDLKDKLVFRALLQPDIKGIDVGTRFLAFSGLGRPEKFFATARAAGLTVITTIAYPDHHVMNEKEWLQLQRLARECDAQLLTTTKDAARLSPRQRGQVRMLPVALDFADKPALAKWLKGVADA